MTALPYWKQREGEKAMTPELATRLDEVVAQLQRLERERMARDYADTTGERTDIVRWKQRSKYVAIDIGSSGAWLVDKASGELYNIKAYGVPDQNKKRKADIGNIFTVDPAVLHTQRYNYLR
jgi:hypothetical protein